MDEVQLAVDLGREGMKITLLVSAPLLIVGLVVGVAISILQAATSIQEQTLSFVPKILAVAFTFMLLMPWIVTVLMEYTRRLLLDMAHIFQ